MSVIDNITVEDFKAQFPRFTPVYLPLFVEGDTYFKGDIVFYNGLFYQVIVENTTQLPSVITDWSLINQSIYNYTQDNDIINAMAEARANFNETLYGDNTKLAFLYLTAYYLTVDFQNAMGANNIGVVQSKSVGSVSESYAIPQWVVNNPILSAYASNGYGRKYLSIIRPYLVGNVMFFKGGITFG
jgi:hypothetical protein